MFRSEVGQIIPGRRTPLGDLMPADQLRLIDAIVDVVAEHRRLLYEHHYPRIDARLHLWWAAQPPKTPEERNWRPYTADGVEEVETLEATHATIIRHPRLAARLRTIMSKGGPTDAPSQSTDRAALIMEHAAR
jgi:hypothetical protein